MPVVNNPASTVAVCKKQTIKRRQMHKALNFISISNLKFTFFKNFQRNKCFFGPICSMIELKMNTDEFIYMVMIKCSQLQTCSVGGIWDIRNNVKEIAHRHRIICI